MDSADLFKRKRQLDPGYLERAAQRYERQGLDPAMPGADRTVKLYEVNPVPMTKDEMYFYPEERPTESGPCRCPFCGHGKVWGVRGPGGVWMGQRFKDFDQAVMASYGYNSAFNMGALYQRRDLFPMKKASEHPDPEAAAMQESERRGPQE